MKKSKTLLSLKFGCYVNSKDEEKWRFYTSGEKIKYMTRSKAVLKQFDNADKKSKKFVTDLKKNLKLKTFENEGLIKFELNSKGRKKKFYFLRFKMK